jgi:hypothetical protein
MLILADGIQDDLCLRASEIQLGFSACLDFEFWHLKHLNKDGYFDSK